jgi:FG-GAP-like repeat
MKRCCWLSLLLLVPCVLVGLDADARDKKPLTITWKKIVLDKNFRSEGVGVADVNKDGKIDVIVGDCWYEAPQDPAGEWKRHILRNDKSGKPADRVWSQNVYTDSFCCFTDDFNGDGYPDVIVIPFPGDPCYWYENPGAKGGLWKQHFLTNSACNETPIYVDLFKTGKKYLVMGWNPLIDEANPKKGSHNDRGEMCYFVPGKDPTMPWQRISISGAREKGGMPGTGKFSHGLGHGDVNGDGRIDILCADGWWEQPEKADGKPWKFHAVRITDPCADMYTYDMTGTGKADVISTSAHGYGFWWSQQKDSNAFVQRALFPDPFAVAKLPPRVTLNAEEKALYEAITRVRTDHFKRSPFAADPELCRMAHDHAERLAKSDAKEVNVAGDYKGKVLVVASKRFAKPADEKKDDKKKDQLTPLQQFALTLLPDNKKDHELVLPGFEVGVGSALLSNGEIQYTLLIGDRQQFSLPSQTHALHCVDIDGDGLKDFITGRRWWAHGERGDAGPNDPANLYWFQAKRGRDGMITFRPHLIDDGSGVGTSFAVADVNGDGLPDIVVANKRGVHLFLQQR